MVGYNIKTGTNSNGAAIYKPLYDSSTNVACGSSYLEDVTFTMAEHGYSGDTYTTGKYVKGNSSVLGGKWGSLPLSYFDPCPFTHKDSCPIPYRPTGSSYETTDYWGDTCILAEGANRTASDGVSGAGTANRNVYLAYEGPNPNDPSGSAKGIWYSDDNEEWTLLKEVNAGAPAVIFIDLVGGGGKGSNAAIKTDTGAGIYTDIYDELYIRGGGGGGGGATASVALNLAAIFGKVSIEVGAGSKGSGSGGDSFMRWDTQTKSYFIAACGGGDSIAVDPTLAKNMPRQEGGEGGTVLADLGFTGDPIPELYNDGASGSSYSDDGLLYYKFIYGADGGSGGSLDYTKFYGTVDTDSKVANLGDFVKQCLPGFGIIDDKKEAFTSGQYGYRGSYYCAFTDGGEKEYCIYGGGSGASALGGGYATGHDYSWHGAGGGGNGGSAWVRVEKDSSGNTKGTNNNAGCAGMSGACILHYNYHDI